MAKKGEYQVRANYPLARRAGDYIFVSGVAAKQPDGSVAGASVDELGTVSLDVRTQTHATIANIQASLESVGAGLEDVVEFMCFLTTMADFGRFNEVYNGYFSRETGPARTTVAVHQLPHPHFLVEMKAIAYKPI